jgi:transglutaminase-like putative cysteine protease
MSSSGTAPAAPAPLHGAIQRYFEIALYLLVLTGFATLASTGGLDSFTVTLVSAALLLRGYLLFRGSTWIIAENWTGILTLAYVAFYLADYLMISGGFLGATVHLVLFVMVVRLFSAQRDRDFYFLSVTAFLMVLSAALLTVDGVFLLAFAGFLLAAVGTFILMEMRHISAKTTIHSRDSGSDRVYGNMAKSLAVAAPVLLVCILLAAGAIFFVLPRISAGYLSAYAPGGEITSGFSDRVQLGRIGEIQQSSAVVMHIQIDGDAQGSYDLKWRGVALENFDGRTWSSNGEQRPVPQSADGHFALLAPPASVRKDSSRPIHYRVLMEPVGMNVFFLAATPESLEGNYRRVATDEGGGVFDLDPERPVNRYAAVSDVSQASAAELRAAGQVYSPGMLASYLKLPTLDTRIPQMAKQITAVANNDYDKALALETYLRTRFAYTLQLSRTVPRDPLANFLFERKQGHCEYFASAMAVMLRTLGIPSRVVNGFRTGEFNDLTGQYVVRASNAHSWVEAYFPNYGWVAFDPTPGAAIPVRTGWNRVALYVDALASFWREWVVNYDAGRQQTLAVSATSGGLRLVGRLRRQWRQHYDSLLATARRTQNNVLRSPVRWLVMALLGISVLALLLNARRLWELLRKRRLASRPERFPRQAATIWYERMTANVARRGWRKSPAQTPVEFVLRIDDVVVREKVAKFTRHYESARFDDSVEDVRRLPELYEEISAAGKR